MPVHGVDPGFPVERVPEVEREAGAVEHEKQSGRVRRVARGHSHSHPRKGAEDEWCGHENAERSGREAEELVEAPRRRRGPKDEKKSLDYKA